MEGQEEHKMKADSEQDKMMSEGRSKDGQSTVFSQIKGKLYFNIDDPDRAVQERPSRILIIDDNHFSALALLTQLQFYNIESDLAEDLSRALRFIDDKASKQEPMYELILIEYYMPKKNGLIMAEKIREFLADENF